MTLDPLFQSVILGIVEGLTEFLPISSTGHLILTSHLMGMGETPGKVTEVVIQMGAILAVCWFYRKRLLHTAFTLHNHASSRRFALAVIIAMLPAGLFGILAHDFIKEVLFSPIVVAVMLIAGGIAIFIIERFRPTPRYDDVTHITPKLALYIGLCQALAMVPGVSRSGATIMGAIALKVERKTAAEFSFFLSIPTLMGAAAYDLYKNYHLLKPDDWLQIGVGFAAAFITAMAVIRWFLRYVSKHDFTAFAWYRIAIGSVMLVYFLRIPS